MTTTAVQPTGQTAVLLRARNQKGYLYEASGAFYLRYYRTEIIDGVEKRIQISHRLCMKDKKDHLSIKSKAVRLLQQEHMLRVNQGIELDSPALPDMRIVDFWEQKYLPYCETGWKGVGMKASTVRGYKQIWEQHLKAHFGKTTLRNYTTEEAKALLNSLKTKLNKNTLKHIRGLASALLTEAIDLNFRENDNPWKVKIPKDAIEVPDTPHYTLAQVEDMITALIDHVDCQLVIALSGFMGLRPGEIAGLKWENIDWTNETVYIDTNVVNGIVGIPKSKTSIASLPLIDQALVPLRLWHIKARSPAKGWVFENRNGDPVDLHNLVNRVIIPHVNGGKECVICKKTLEGSGVTWTGLYSGRRGACTAIVDLTGGNYAVAQGMLRHKSMTTTLNIYKKSIVPASLKAGMKLFSQKVLESKTLDSGGAKE